MVPANVPDSHHSCTSDAVLISSVVHAEETDEVKALLLGSVTVDEECSAMVADSLAQMTLMDTPAMMPWLQACCSHCRSHCL